MVCKVMGWGLGGTTDWHIMVGCLGSGVGMWGHVGGWQSCGGTAMVQHLHMMGFGGSRVLVSTSPQSMRAAQLLCHTVTTGEVVPELLLSDILHTS